MKHCGANDNIERTNQFRSTFIAILHISNIQKRSSWKHLKGVITRCELYKSLALIWTKSSQSPPRNTQSTRFPSLRVKTSRKPQNTSFKFLYEHWQTEKNFYMQMFQALENRTSIEHLFLLPQFDHAYCCLFLLSCLSIIRMLKQIKNKEFIVFMEFQGL